MTNPSRCDPLIILKQQVRGGIPLTIDQACHLLEAVDAYREVVDKAEYQWGDDNTWVIRDLSKTSEEADIHLEKATEL